MSQDYQNLDHLKRLQRALHGGKHAPLKSIFQDIVRMNLRRWHEPGLSWAEEEPYEHYDDFLRRCWHIHHLVGDLWAKYCPTIPEEDWSV